MPYLIQKESKRLWVVRKKWSGKKVGATDSYPKALAMIRAIHSNEKR
jgi:hypothetical protein